MATSVKNVVAHVQNIGNSLVNPNSYDNNNYDDNNYDEVIHKSLSHGNDFNKHQTSIKNKVIEGFNGRLTETSQSVLLNTQMSSAQQEELNKLKKEYALNQTAYNTLINNIPATNNSAKLQQLTQLGTKLDLLSQQINTLNNLLKDNVTTVNDTISANSDAREEYTDDIASNYTNEANMINLSNNIQNMLNDSNISTLQQNYSYILVSILAAVSILVAINVIKNN